MILQDVIAKIESNDDCNAIRFEPTLFQSKPAWIGKSIEFIKNHHNNISDDTAWMIACSSWGRYQLLGCNIYSLGFDSTIFDFVDNDHGEQEEIFGDFILTSGYKSVENIANWNQTQFENFAHFYNGPGNIEDYANKMKAIANE